MTCRNSFAINFILKGLNLEVEGRAIVFWKQPPSLFYVKAIESAKKFEELFSLVKTTSGGVHFILTYLASLLAAFSFTRDQETNRGFFLWYSEIIVFDDVLWLQT